MNGYGKCIVHRIYRSLVNDYCIAYFGKFICFIFKDFGLLLYLGEIGRVSDIQTSNYSKKTYFKFGNSSFLPHLARLASAKA